jgi:hypothetical protein
MIDKRPDQPYASALDIPSYRDMYMQLRAVKPLLLFSPKMRRQMKDIENKLRYLARTVDEFYDLFGPRHLVFHGQLNPEDIGPLLKLPVEEAERNLIGLYKDHDWLDLWVRRIGRNPMGPWQTLLDKALEDTVLNVTSHPYSFSYPSWTDSSTLSSRVSGLAYMPASRGICKLGIVLSVITRA